MLPQGFCPLLLAASGPWGPPQPEVFWAQGAIGAIAEELHHLLRDLFTDPRRPYLAK